MSTLLAFGALKIHRRSNDSYSGTVSRSSSLLPCTVRVVVGCFAIFAKYRGTFGAAVWWSSSKTAKKGLASLCDDESNLVPASMQTDMKFQAPSTSSFTLQIFVWSTDTLLKKRLQYRKGGNWEPDRTRANFRNWEQKTGSEHAWPLGFDHAGEISKQKIWTY